MPCKNLAKKNSGKKFKPIFYFFFKLKETFKRPKNNLKNGSIKLAENSKMEKNTGKH